MSVSWGKSIVKDTSLVVAFDVADNVCYPRSGVTMYDLSGGGNNSTLTNGPTYSNNKLGALTFNGTTQYGSFFTPNLTTTATIEMWCSVTGTPTQAMYMGFFAYDVYFYSAWGVGFNTGNSDLYGISAATVTSLGLSNNWRHYIFEMRSDVSYTNNKIYVNGVLQTLASQGTGAENAANRTFNSGNGRIGYWASTGLYYMPMDLGVFRVYNRSLTQAEISQNFNALRGRFGV